MALQQTLSSSLKREAMKLDKADPLASFRKRFHYPKKKGKAAVYFCGNSLGLMPKAVSKAMKEEIRAWATYAVEGHWKASNPWLTYHKLFSPLLAPLCGAKPTEVVAMNSLTVNLHLALASFYKPNAKRFVILHEYKAFSSDLYALESVVHLHGLNPKKCLRSIEALDAKSIENIIREEGSRLALVMLGAVNYYSGEALDLKKITASAHSVGAIAGFDLAHAIGNVSLKLHDWNVDFAVWCSYKYLNSGPGATGGLFVHEQHWKKKTLPRMAGWWGHDEKSRFSMKPGFNPMPGAEGWQLSNAPVFNMVAQHVSLKLFKEAGLTKVYKKGQALGAFFFHCLNTLGKVSPKEKRPYAFSIITPVDPKRRGCQLSLRIQGGKGKALFSELENAGFMGDWREPDVIRLSPVPLYNSFSEIYRLCAFLCTRAHLVKP